MKFKIVLTSLAAVLLSASSTFAQTVLAKWTFETTQPGVVDGPAVPGGGIWITNIAAEVGSGTASGLHASAAATYSSPAGNGSSHSFSANNWTVGDIYQFAVSTVGYTNISVTYDQISSATGPGQFYFAYSTDGINFTQVGANYSVIINATPNTWSSGTPITTSSYSNNLSAVFALTNAPVVYFRLVDASTTSANGGTVATAGTDRVDNFAVIGTSTVAAPEVTSITPSNVTATAGTTVAFTVTALGGPASNFWYKISGGTTSLIAGATSATLTLPHVLAANAGGYFAVLTNTSGMGTSPVATLTITGDPHIAVQPANTHGLLDGVAMFSVTGIGTAISYQWYFTDSSGDIVGPVTDGASTASGVAVVSGSTSSLLTISNIQPADLTNVVVVVSNAFSSVTSSMASLLDVSSTNAILVFWDFNGPEFTNTDINPNSIISPSPYIGVGTASPVGSTLLAGTSPFSGSVFAGDGLGFTTHLPPFSWGTDNYPASGGNKQNGVQFDVSTLGAKNIKLSYQSRVSATASDYERLQYTTNGIGWIDYPSSSTFSNIGTTYLPYFYDFTGFPGVNNNSNFAVRVVTEFQNTATYGVGTTTNYVGTANSYGTAGTVTYDVVTFTGEAITNDTVPPTISSIPDTNSPDYVSLTLDFTVTDTYISPDTLTYSATAFNPTTVNPTFTFGGSGNNRTLTIIPNTIPDPIDVGPILVTVTDTNRGDSAATWFLLTLSSVNLPPTNTLTSLKATNTLANTAVTVPFSVGDDRTAPSGLTYTNTSGNSTLVPAGNIVINNAGTTNPSVTITPAHNQVGVATVTVSVYDNDTQEPRNTPATIAFTVRPNTNVVAIDYFGYDGGGALDAVSGGFWQHLSGNFGQMKVADGVVTVDTIDNTENLQTALLGAPYKTNTPGATLYASYIVTMDTVKQPIANGSYFSAFNDGSGNTADVEGLVVAATNGAAPGFYRLGVANVVGATALNSQMFPQDLSPGSNYVVVVSLTLSNGFSTLWVNPSSPSSPSITDTTLAASATNLYNMTQFELRESGATAGVLGISKLKVGTTFDSVLPQLHIQSDGINAVVNWSDPTLTIQSATNVTGPYVDVNGETIPYTNGMATNVMQFFRFKRPQ